MEQNNPLEHQQPKESLKPVSEEGEKKEYIHDWQDQMTVAAGIDPDVADELEELRTYKHVCNESIAHLHRENERLMEVIKMALVRNPPSHTYKILKEGLEKCEGEKNNGLGGSSSLEDQESMLSEIIENFQDYMRDQGLGENVRPLEAFFKEELEKFTITRKP